MICSPGNNPVDPLFCPQGEPHAYMYSAGQEILMYHLACVNCGATFPADEIIYNCKKCGHLLAVRYPLDTLSVKRETWNNRPALGLAVQRTAACNHPAGYLTGRGHPAVPSRASG